MAGTARASGYTKHEDLQREMVATCVSFPKVNRSGETEMISDVLSETVNKLDHYLSTPDYDDTYTGEIRDRIVRFRNEAKALRDILDISPRPESV